MVQRTSERVGIQGPGTPELQTQGPGQVAPKNVQGMFSTQVATPLAPQQEPTHELSKMFMDVMKVSGELIQKKITQDRQQAYLEGAAAVGAGIAEEGLKGSIFTRDWKVAGYRDTAGRMAVAEYKADMANNMHKLRELDPTAFKDHVKQYRDGLFPQLEGMSAKARAELFPELLAAEHAAIQRHYSEHAGFVVEQTSKALQLGASQEIAMVTAAKGDPTTYVSAQNSAFEWAHRNIWNNDGLPEATKVKLLSQFIEASVDEGNLGIYDLFKKMPVVDVGGEKVPILSMFPLEDQTKLSKAFETGRNKNMAEYSDGWYRNLDDMEISAAAGNPIAGYNDYAAFIDKGVQDKIITPAQGSAKKQAYAKDIGNAQRAIVAMSAYSTGDTGAIYAAGTTPALQAKAVTEAKLREGVPVNEVALYQIQTGLRTGFTEASKEAGKLLQPAINTLMTGAEGEVHQTSLQSIAAVTLAMEGADRVAAGTVKLGLMSTLTDEQATFMNRVINNISNEKMSPETAVKTARELRIREANLGEPAIQELSRKARAENAAAITDLDSIGWIKEKYRAIAGSLGIGSELAKSGLVPRQKWFEGTIGTTQSVGELKRHLADELEYGTRMAPLDTYQEREDKAVARIMARTVPTQHGNLILPQGTNIHEFFKVKDNVPVHVIAKALEAQLPKEIEKDGYSAAFSASDGQVSVRIWNDRDDIATVNGEVYFTPTELQTEIDKIWDFEQAEMDKLYGQGKKHKGPDGSTVAFNGENSWGVPHDVAFAIRDELVKMEGVRKKSYPDGSGGRTAVGVGISSGNKSATWYPKINPDGTVSDEEITRSFMGASDEYLGNAVEVAKVWGLPENDYATLALLTSLNYQQGPRGKKTPLLEALVAQDQKAAVQAVRQTKAWEYSAASRRAWYERMAKAAAAKIKE